jgi:small subunit ribosomal protein S6
LQVARQYEVLFIVDPEADDDEVSKITDNFKQIVIDQGGSVTKAESLGRRQLAYEILHKKEGTFVDLELEGSGREIAELERRMRVNDRILRYLTVRMDEHRRRAEKLKDRRARKAAKRPMGASPSGRRERPEFPSDNGDEA